MPDSQTPPSKQTPLSKNVAFNHLWVGETASQFGFQVAGLATSTIAINLLNATNSQIGTLNALQTLAFLLIGLPAGAWVDRWRKRRTMVIADVVRMFALASVPLAWWMGELSIVHLMAVATILGFSTVFFDVAYQSYVPQIVSPLQIGDANGRLEASAQVAHIGGPGLAGWLIGVMTAPVAYLFTAGTYGFSALAVALIPGKEEKLARREDSKLLAQIAEGVSYVRSERMLGPLFMCISFAAFTGQGVFTLLPVLALRELGMSAATLGTLFSIGAIGGVLGAACNRAIVARLGEGHAILMCNILGVLPTFALPFAPLAGKHAALVLVVANLIGSFFMTIYNVTQMSLRQRICPPHLLGRLNATFRFAVWGVMPIGAFLAGVAADRFGVTTAMFICVVGTLLAALSMAFTPVVRENGPGPMQIPLDQR